MPTTALTQQTFDQVIASNHIVLVEFWASWCGWCTRFAPVYRSSAETHPDIVHATVDGEAEPALVAAAQVDSYPWLMGFREGLLVYSQAGYQPAAHLEELIQQIRWMDMDAYRRTLADAAQTQVSQPQPAPQPATQSRLAGLAPGSVRYGWPGL
ncbi:thioredoxin family protein [Nocardia cyriacigeorgica]|uniref:thioredoxin family protein n=1 Tax=Nocardia cyriacigeorgica TaxID=135487 RepID=UPI0002D7E2F8|nr:thioredoxin domain-containing protein [Nocardia cyriacigeorgica]MBF6324199.1 thiol reductase thioredoxin [Nocardia cyriacigeorgica]MBF6498082.1 thiol reductase thioredoxin [Nocardia cyriacigeorgica]TLF60250.1 thiol reductase thioredoxin [Nocardia cyriacigeorgica]